MKNNKHLSQLRHLLTIASSALAFGIFLNPMAAKAFSLVPTTTSPNQNCPSQFLIQLDTSTAPAISICDNQPGSFGDLNPLPNIIEFHKQDGNLEVSGTLKRQRINRNLPSTGAQVTGSLLLLTKLNVTNSGNITIKRGNNKPGSGDFFFIFFQDFFSFKDPAYGSQLFKGSFKNSSFNSSATLNGRAYGKLIAIQTGKEDFNRKPPSSSVRIYPEEVTNHLITGNLRQLSLGKLDLKKNATLNLPNSACIVVLDKQATEKDTEQICEPIPEPSATISILTLGVLGGGFLLKRKRK